MTADDGRTVETGGDAPKSAAGTVPSVDRPIDLAAYDAVVYDLDGTLVELAVDWGAVAESVLEVYAEHAMIPPTDELWGLLEAAGDYGIRDPVEEAIAVHERSGARESVLLPLGGRLIESVEDGRESPPAGVCSLNCEEACRVAVETHGLGDALDPDAIVGRDTVDTHKPDPESVLAAVERLGADPARALFVGDSRRDAVAAKRAGVPFAWAADLIDR
ncbi:HAD family hydrolase [Halorubrum lacusprofundi]|jgi:phosphoglycolate phosphatase|uniref:HAD-superfamily hydrolase, subfamily IA, variant 1 n=1 Tax=Halorubrum lacusprofundi (strain ATCC 49239 / DSM 5036 / JCM 8891 / ACAM 34) TaxID=416348 RepID=B9LTA2_HALLT|nr:HAD-IA family hydrolase [Halorubrum lacusprofundi]ACM58074.1 HAD-superfamily hydrolase, subfamily IA, variant 1 [Halorubrum lacusprofundi ATCC 49239]MCG1006157.1 HAD-IA family hydrolase [Halorubrum lacusprofundi]